MSRFLDRHGLLAGGYYAAMCEPPTGNRTAQSRGQIFWSQKQRWKRRESIKSRVTYKRYIHPATIRRGVSLLKG